MSNTQTEVRCGKKIGRGSCRNDALSMVNGEPRCIEHTPQASAEFDVMPLHTPDVTDLPMCSCGCGVQVRRKSRTYLQGHDQRHKGILLRRVREVADADAGRTLVQKGWKGRTEIEAMLADAIERTGGVLNSEEDPEDETDRPVDHMGLRHEAEQPRVSRGRRSDRAPMAHIGNAAS